MEGEDTGKLGTLPLPPHSALEDKAWLLSSYWGGGPDLLRTAGQVGQDAAQEGPDGTKRQIRLSLQIRDKALRLPEGCERV